MTKKQILSKEQITALAASTLSDDPVKVITIPVRNYTWWDRLTRKPKTRQFKLYRIRVCNMKRCAGAAHLLPTVPEQFTSMEELTRVVFPIIHNHLDDVVYLIASCIQNDAREPSPSLIRFIERNMVADDLMDTLITCLTQLGLMSFSQAILLLKGTSANIASATDALYATGPDSKS